MLRGKLMLWYVEIMMYDHYHYIWESCVYRLLYGKYVVLETHITEIWYLSGNEKNIMCFMHYTLFIFVFPKLPLHTFLSATITSQAHHHTQHVLHCPLFLSFFNNFNIKYIFKLKILLPYVIILLSNNI